MSGWFSRRKPDVSVLDAPAPDVSVIVVVYNMEREAPRTLRSLSATYQRDIAADDYEVIVVDNGSSPAFDINAIDGLEGNFRVIRLDPAPGSPAKAVNVGLAAARGKVIGVMVDGARMVTPGLLHFARHGANLYPRSVVVTLGWYLGLDQQRWAIESGYNREREDALLESINWPEDGYRLFNIAAPDETTIDGWFGVIGESNALFLNRESWNLLDGVEEGFNVPGGGFLNLDLLARAFELPESKLVVLLGEGTFHQLHGGVATNAHPRDINVSVAKWRAQYEAIRGRPWSPPSKANRTYLGVLPQPPLAHFARSVIIPANGRPLGETFDPGLWSVTPPPRPADPVVAGLVDLAHEELRARRFPAATAVARLARSHAPDEPAVQRILAVSAGWLAGPADPETMGPGERANYHLACGKAFNILGRSADAERSFQDTITADDDRAEAYFSLVRLRMPGPEYKDWLRNLHVSLTPATYLEIGVEYGFSISLANAPTRAIGVDPEPKISHPFKTETHIFSETSDTFFENNRLPMFLDGEPLRLAFIDGLHAFYQSLRDFINIERFCNSKSVVAIHDTIPFDEITQRSDRQRKFYTGDIWKVVLCLKYYRPDLDIVTVPTSPSGLTIITNLDPNSRVLIDSYDEAVARFAHANYEEYATDFGSALNITLNDWDAFETRLRARSIV